MFISLPEDAAREIGDFSIDPDVLIPVEIVDGNESWTMRNLSWEMIIAAMLKVLVHDPGNANAGYYREFVLAVRPSIVDELFANGMTQVEERNFGAAEEVFAAVRVLRPDDPSSGINLALVYEEHADVYEQAGKNDLADAYRREAFRLYNELARLFPDDSQVRFNAGHYFLKVKNYARAREHLERYLSLGADERQRDLVSAVLGELERRDESDVLFNEAYDFILLGREREAMEKLRTFIAVHPNVWNAWFLLGWAHRRLEEYAEGEKAFIRAVELGSEETDTLNELAICRMELGKYDECRATLHAALSHEPENVKIISNLGILELKQGRREEAVRFFASAAEIDPADPIARRYLDFLGRTAE